jgi:hypothetical protein
MPPVTPPRPVHIMNTSLPQVVRGAVPVRLGLVEGEEARQHPSDVAGNCPPPF